MRRPAPLPPPETRPGGTESARQDPPLDADPQGREDAAPYEGEDAAGDDGHDDAMADVVALDAATRAAEAERRAAGLPAERSDNGGDDLEGRSDIGVRDVWRAARARRKALRAEVRRFTVRQRRRRMVWIGAAASLGLLVLGTVAAAYSPLFAVDRITVVGTSSLDPAAVQTALADQLGTPLPLVDSSAVKAALVAFPLVESYTLEARPPHELTVRIVERTPVGSIDSAAGHTLVDAAGVALATSAEPPPGYPVLDVAGGTSSQAFQAVGRVYRSLPEEIRTQVTSMAATTANDVSFELGDAAVTVVWGNSDESARKAVVLQRTMASLPPDQVSTYDVSSPDAVVIR